MEGFLIFLPCSTRHNGAIFGKRAAARLLQWKDVRACLICLNACDIGSAKSEDVSLSWDAEKSNVLKHNQYVRANLPLIYGNCWC